MKVMTTSRRQEAAVYAVAWGIVYAVPVVLTYLATASTAAHFSWQSVMVMWVGLAPFAGLFLIHDLLVSPLMVKHKRYTLYGVCSLLLVALFMWGVTSRPWREYRFRQFDRADVVFLKPPPPAPEHARDAFSDSRPEILDVLNPHELVNCAVALMMLGLNIGVKMFFKAQRDERIVREVERQSLEKELEYLKYQINPHFFMNTLANIHALVEIDSKKAREAILDLSRMMRYVLREGAATFVPLAHDVDFMRHYLSLMRLRYVDKVDVSVDFPAVPGDVCVPPLLFVTFVENAFKHGISYREPSFVSLALSVGSGVVSFRCANSRHADDVRGTGIGLDNVRRRLGLIYGGRYTLEITQPEGRYEVSLTIPIDHDQVLSNG